MDELSISLMLRDYVTPLAIETWHMERPTRSMRSCFYGSTGRYRHRVSIAVASMARRAAPWPCALHETDLVAMQSERLQME